MSKDIFQLCNSITEQEALRLDENKYIAQLKKDGERCMAFIEEHKVILLNRRGNVITHKFPEIAKELEQLDNCVLDSEMCSQDDNFNTLQKRALLKNPIEIVKRVKEIPCVMWIFDILKIESNNLMQKPLKERIRELYSFLDGKEMEYCKILPFESIKESLIKAKEKNGEGVVIKSLEGIYTGKRTNDFLKCKFFQECEINLTTYTPNNAGYRCEDREGNAVQVSGRQSLEVVRQIQEKGNVEVIVQYLTKSKEGRMRFPSFRGIK